MSLTKTLVLENKKDSLIRNGAVLLLSSLLIGLCSQVSIPLPFTPVPIAIQNSLILVLAILLGSRWASGAVFFFLVQGIMGLPVFALGKTGLATFLGPSGGYLVGYLVAAFATGLISEKIQRKTLPTAFLAMAVGNGIIYLFGAAYLSTFVGLNQAIVLGIIPFLVGDLFKMIAALKVLQWIGWNKSSCR